MDRKELLRKEIKEGKSKFTPAERAWLDELGLEMGFSVRIDPTGPILNKRGALEQSLEIVFHSKNHTESEANTDYSRS